MQTTLITVTYGKRFHYLCEVIDSALEQGIDEVVVIDNGSKISSMEAAAGKYDDRVKFFRSDENLGSAKGFKWGIEKALETSSDFFLILDDDNVLENRALELLKEQYRELCKVGNERIILHSLRVPLNCDDISKVPVVTGDLLINAYIGFCITSIPEKIKSRLSIFRKPSKAKKTLSRNCNTTILNRCMYGGMFFHRDLINHIGLPRDDFYLYYDDFEFSHRAILNKYAIYMVKKSVVRDIDGRWDMKDVKAKRQTFLFTGRLVSNDARRIYYTVRNAAYFESNILNNRNSYLTKINKFIYLAALYSYAAILRRKDNFELIHNAIKDGENGKLGKNDKYPL